MSSVLILLTCFLELSMGSRFDDGERTAHLELSVDSRFDDDERAAHRTSSAKSNKYSFFSDSRSGSRMFSLPKWISSVAV